MLYAIWTDTNKEEKTVDRLREVLPRNLYRDFWVPKRIERQKRNKNWKNVEKPMFPGYLFVETEEPEKIKAFLQRNAGFQVLLKLGDMYVPLSETEESQIRSLTENSAQMGISYGIFEEGRFKVIRGPLYGMEKYFKKVDLHHRRILMEMELFGAPRKIWGAIDFVE